MLVKTKLDLFCFQLCAHTSSNIFMSEQRKKSSYVKCIAPIYRSKLQKTRKETHSLSTKMYWFCQIKCTNKWFFNFRCEAQTPIHSCSVKFKEFGFCIRQRMNEEEKKQQQRAMNTYTESLSYVWVCWQRFYLTKLLSSYRSFIHGVIGCYRYV